MQTILFSDFLVTAPNNTAQSEVAGCFKQRWNHWLLVGMGRENKESKSELVKSLVYFCLRITQ